MTPKGQIFGHDCIAIINTHAQPKYSGYDFAKVLGYSVFFSQLYFSSHHDERHKVMLNLEHCFEHSIVHLFDNHNFSKGFILFA